MFISKSAGQRFGPDYRRVLGVVEGAKEDKAGWIIQAEGALGSGCS